MKWWDIISVPSLCFCIYFFSYFCDLSFISTFYIQNHGRFWNYKHLLRTFNIFCHSRLYDGEGNGTPLQYSCLENPMDGGAWWAIVHGVAKSWTRLSDFTFMHWRRKWQPTPVFLPAESQGQGEPGGLPSVGSHRVGQDWSDLAAAAAGYMNIRI